MLSCIPVKQTVPDGTSKVGGKEGGKHEELSAIAKSGTIRYTILACLGVLRYELHTRKYNASGKVMPPLVH